MRFEPPAHEQAREVSYAALAIPTALAEVFQHRRVINTRRDAPYLTGWHPARTLTLLDLAGPWPLAAGASHVINTGRRDHCLPGPGRSIPPGPSSTGCGITPP